MPDFRQVFRWVGTVSLAAIVAVAVVWHFFGVGAAAVVAALCLAVATVWLGLGAWRSVDQAARFQAQEKLDRRERHFRAALLEQLDETRMWLRWHPNYSAPRRGQEVLKHHEPVFRDLRSLL